VEVSFTSAPVTSNPLHTQRLQVIALFGRCSSLRASSGTRADRHAQPEAGASGLLAVCLRFPREPVPGDRFPYRNRNRFRNRWELWELVS